MVDVGGDRISSTVRAVDDENIHPGVHESGRSFYRFRSDPDCGADDQSTEAIFRGIRKFALLFNIARSDEPL